MEPKQDWKPEREPAWLTSAVDQRLALMAETLPDSFAPNTILTSPLTEPPEGATKEETVRWEHTCDNCGAYARDTLVSGYVQRTLHGLMVMIFFGYCPDCGP